MVVTSSNGCRRRKNFWNVSGNSFDEAQLSGGVEEQLRQWLEPDQSGHKQEPFLLSIESESCHKRDLKKKVLLIYVVASWRIVDSRGRKSNSPETSTDFHIAEKFLLLVGSAFFFHFPSSPLRSSVRPPNWA